MVRLLLIALGLAGLTALSGCGGYASTSEEFRRSLNGGQADAALVRVNEALGVERAEQLPSEPDEDTPLLLLERGTILQALGRNDLSARDFKLADTRLDVLDLTGDTAGEISKYLFSDDATVYKAPPHEKLLLNTINMINFLVLGDTSGAKVEARRMTINRKFLEREEGAALSMLALGSYLSGFAFEVAGESDIAMRHYGDALDAGGLPTLTEAVRRLAARTGASDKRFADLLAEPTASPAASPEAAPEAPAASPEAAPEAAPIAAPAPAHDARHAELLVIVQTGMAPYLTPERLPIGAAIVAASDPGRGARLDANDRNRAQVFAAKGVLKWVNYPRLERTPIGGGTPAITLGAQPLDTHLGLDVEQRTLDRYDQFKGTLIAASLTRLLTRAVAGEVTQAVAKGASGDNLVGLLAGLAVEGAMTAADTPDTRSWVTLPARFHLARARVPAGQHTLSVRYRGQTRTRTVELPPGGFAVINFSELR